MKTSGKFNSTHPLLGFDPIVVGGEPKVGFYSVNAEEMKTVEWIFHEFCKLASYERLVEACHSKGILNKNGEPFTACITVPPIGSWASITGQTVAPGTG